MNLRLRGISKAWPGGVVALREIGFCVPPGSMTVLIGPSGSGKTTLLKVIAGLIRPDSGSIDGQGGRRAMVFQEDSLWPHLTLEENIALPLRVVRKFTAVAAIEHARNALSQWGLADRRRAYPAELSGGQRQRGALIRAMAYAPEVLCLDEITNGLDPEATAELLALLPAMKKSGTILVMATHHISFARAAADYVIFVEAGAVVEQGSSQRLLFQPEDDRIRRFLASYDGASVAAGMGGGVGDPQPG